MQARMTTAGLRSQAPAPRVAPFAAPRLINAMHRPAAGLITKPAAARPVARGLSSQSSYDAIGADIPAELTIFNAELPRFQGWSPSANEQAAEASSRKSVSGKAQPSADCSDEEEEHAATLSTEQCSIMHPGSLTCTRVSARHDPSNGYVKLSLVTSVRKTEATVSSNMLDLEELGWLALRTTAAQRAAELKPLTLSSGEHDERHGEVLDLLRRGIVTEAEKNTNGYGHVSYVVTLEDPQTKQRCKALFKPSMEGDGDGWHRVPIEAAAYRLNRLLGMDYVPPAVFRSSCDVDWQRFEGGGVFIYWCKHAEDLGKVPMKEWGCKPEVLLSDTRILDVLIQNSDRHAAHFLWADHWSKGSHQGGKVSHNTWRGRKYPVLIDQAAGFRPEAFVSLDHENAFGTGPTRTISAKTYMRLRFLDHSTVSDALREFISEDELQQLLARKDSILRYFDKLVQAQGYSQVVLEDSCDLPR